MMKLIKDRAEAALRGEFKPKRIEIEAKPKQPEANVDPKEPPPALKPPSNTRLHRTAGFAARR